MPKRYYWLKLKEDFFAQPKIKKLRRIAGGDTYTIIYLKMQLLSLKNEGRLLFEGTEDNFVDEIALTIDEDPENVSVTVAYLMRQGLLEQCSDDEYSLPQAIQSIGRETDAAQRMRLKREREQKLIGSNNVSQECNNVTDKRNIVTQECNNVQNCYTEKEIEKDIDIELEIDTSSNEEVCKSPGSVRATIPYRQIQEMFNSICTHFPKCQALSDRRKKAIKARFENGMTVDDFKKLFEKAEASSFLRGKNDRDWQASFDWLIKDANMVKVLDGNYDNRGGNDYGRNVGAQAAGRNPNGRFEEIPGGLQL